MNTPEIPNYSPGLAGVIAGTSALSKVDPLGDELIYYGYRVSGLCEHSSFEEVCYLLLNASLPNKKELETFDKKLKNNREVPSEIINYLCKMPKEAHYMDILRSGISLMAHYDPKCDDNSPEMEKEKAIKMLAKTPTILAARVRALQGKKPVAPHKSLNHAANFLQMVSGQEPDADFASALDDSLICYAEHGFNASTFTARVCTSTLSDIYSAVCGAIGALKGPLHGGANEAAMNMLLEIGEPAKTERWVRDALVQKKKIMGFGHRVYKKRDSRAPILKAWGKKLAAKTGETKWHEMSDIIEKILWEEKKLFPNVDFPAATLYYLMGLPINTDTPLFVVSRISGWCAHVIEQRADNKLIRPDCYYTGPEPRDYVPMNKR